MLDLCGVNADSAGEVIRRKTRLNLQKSIRKQPEFI